jgi:hypothetical protein
MNWPPIPTSSSRVWSIASRSACVTDKITVVERCYGARAPLAVASIIISNHGLLRWSAILS